MEKVEKPIIDRAKSIARAGIAASVIIGGVSAAHAEDSFDAFSTSSYQSELQERHADPIKGLNTSKLIYRTVIGGIAQDNEVFAPTEFGFNTHMQKTENGEWDVERFKKEVDFLVENKQGWVRINIDDSINLPPESENEMFRFEEAGIKAYEEALKYAHEKGIDVVLVTNVPGFAKDYLFDDYEKIAGFYYKELAKRFDTFVDVWQIFNEADRHNFRDYSSLYKDSDPNEDKLPSDEYLNEIVKIVEISGNAIKSVNPEAQIAVNVSGWPVDDEMQDRWEHFLDSLSPVVDELILDFYPDANVKEIEQLSERIQAIKERYVMHVSVGEFGMCTGDGRFSEEDQGKFINMMIDEIKIGNPAVAMLYRLSDGLHNEGCEGTFGILNADGTRKSSADEIMESMQSEFKKVAEDMKE